jgi:hypothetical protein
MWGGTVFLRAFDSRAAKGRVLDALAALALLGATFILTHTPAYLVAKAGGYDREFRQQYAGWADYLGGQAGAMVGARPCETRGSARSQCRRPGGPTGPADRGNPSAHDLGESAKRGGGRQAGGQGTVDPHLRAAIFYMQCCVGWAAIRRREFDFRGNTCWISRARSPCSC